MDCRDCGFVFNMPELKIEGVFDDNFSYFSSKPYIVSAPDKKE